MALPTLRHIRACAGLLLTALLAACSTPAPPPPVCPKPEPCPVCRPAPAPTPAPAPAPPAASQLPLQPAAWEDLPGWTADPVNDAWPAFLQSCAALSGKPEWRPVCEAAGALGAQPSADAVRGFLRSHLQPWALTNQDGTREGMVTGYYEPLIHGSRVRSARYRWPIYGVPDDMLTIDLGDAYPELKKYRLRGRLVGNKVVPYWSRGDVGQMEGHFPARVLLWAEDPIELFFLQVQGSGQVELPDGSRVRIGYADQNGYPYVSIGRWLVDHGEMKLSQASMAGIKAWARANPKRLGELLAVNPSYVFFKELPGGDQGPIGALGVPLVAGRSIAVDPQHVPLGAPVWLAASYPGSSRAMDRLVMAQDTGAAIKGVVRADFFWGFGDEAGRRAGKMRQTGRMWVLLPTGYAPN